MARHPRCACGAEPGARHTAPCVLVPCTCGTTSTLHARDCSIVFEPNVGPQTQFMESTASEVLYGGAAGGGKSAALIALPLRWTHIPAFSAIIVRRTTKQLVDLLKKAIAVYPRFKARSREKSGSITWLFPSGATVLMTHLQHEKTATDFDGHEFQLECWDEVPHFTEQQYRWLRARIRGTNTQLPRFTRCTANPPGADNAQGLWVFRRYAAWLDPNAKIPGLPERRDEKGLLPPARPGRVLHFLKDEGSDEERVVSPGTPEALSRTFIPAKLEDNPHVTEEYRGQLRDLDLVRRSQLRDGNWLIRPAAGLLFRRAWFDVVERPPADAEVVTRIRMWDRAASEVSPENPDPDWTAGVKMSRTKDGTVYVEDVVRGRWRPKGVDEQMIATAKQDGWRCPVGIFQDPGSAGVAEVDATTTKLGGFIIRVVKPTGDKVVRAQPLSAQAERKMVKLVRGPWIDAYLQELEAFPTKGIHDDQVDGSSSAYLEISESSGLNRLRMLAQM